MSLYYYSSSAEEISIDKVYFGVSSSFVPSLITFDPSEAPTTIEDVESTITSIDYTRGYQGVAGLVTRYSLRGYQGYQGTSGSLTSYISSTGDGRTHSGNLYARSYYETSDVKKKKIADRELSNALELLRELHPVVFNFKNTPNKRSIGLIAQDVEKCLPELVIGREGEKRVLYSRLNVVLCKAIQEVLGN